jgi:hypothetical protein
MKTYLTVYCHEIHKLMVQVYTKAVIIRNALWLFNLDRCYRRRRMSSKIDKDAIREKFRELIKYSFLYTAYFKKSKIKTNRRS